jgi:protein TonB
VPAPSIFSLRFIVSERAYAFDRRNERHGYRFAIAIVAASVLWGSFLVSSMRLFTGDMPAPRPPDTIRMQLVELPPPMPSAPPAKHEEPKAAPVPVVAPKPAPVRPARARRSSATPKQPAAMPSDDAPPAQPPVHQAPAARASTDDVQPAPSTHADSSATHAFTAGNAQARLLSEPLPMLPDDLREQAYQAVAVARFLVHADGTFDIELVKPTPNPRLNQILLETLRKWRFFPAMENGHPVDSQQDVRVHFNVD